MSLSTVKNRLIPSHITEKVFEYLDPDFLRRMSGILSHCGFDFTSLPQMYKAMICDRPVRIDRPIGHSFILISDSIADEDLIEELCNRDALAIVSEQSEVQKLPIHAKTQLISSTILNFPASLESLDQAKAVELSKLCMKNNLWRCLHLLLKHNKNIKSSINLNILDAYRAGHREAFHVLLSHPVGQKLPKLIILDIIAKFDLHELFPLIEKDLQSNGIEGFIKELSETELLIFSFNLDIINPLLLLLCEERDISFELDLQKFHLPNPSILSALKPYISPDHLPKSARPIYQLACSKKEDYEGIPHANEISERGFEMLVSHAFYQGHLSLLADLHKINRLHHRAIPSLDPSSWRIPDSLPSLSPLFWKTSDVDERASLAAMMLYEFVNNINPKWILPSRDVLLSLKEPLLRYHNRLELRSNSSLPHQMLTLKFLLRCLFPLSKTSNETIRLQSVETEKVNNFICKNINTLSFDESFKISFELLKLDVNLFMHRQKELSPNFVVRACKEIYERVCINEDYAILLSNFFADVRDLSADYHKKILIECHKMGMIDLFFSKDVLKYTKIPVQEQITWTYYLLAHAIDLRLIPNFDAFLKGMESPAYSATEIRILSEIFLKYNQESEVQVLFQIASRKTNLFQSSHFHAEKLLAIAVERGEIMFIDAISKQKKCPIASGVLQKCMVMAKEKNDQEIMRKLFLIRPSLFIHNCLSGEFSEKNFKCYKNLHALFGDQTEMIELTYAVYMLLAEDQTYLAKKMIQDPTCLHAFQSINDWIAKRSPLSFTDDEVDLAASSAIQFIENCFAKDQNHSQDAAGVKVLDLSIPKEKRTLSASEFFQDSSLENITPSQIQMIYDEIDSIPLDLQKSNLGIVLPFVIYRRLLAFSNRLYGDKEIALHLKENPFIKLFYSGIWRAFFQSYSLSCRQQLKMKMDARETRERIAETLQDFERAFKHLEDFLTSQSLFDPTSDFYDIFIREELSTFHSMIQLYKAILSSRSSINILYEKEICNFPQLGSHQEQDFDAKESLVAAAELISFLTNLIGEDMPIGLSPLPMFAKTFKELEIYRNLLSGLANKEFDEIKPILKNIQAKLKQSQIEWGINFANIYANTQRISKDNDALIIAGATTKASLESLTSVIEKTFISRDDQRYRECVESMQRFVFYFSLFPGLIPPKGSQPSQVLRNLRDQMAALKSAVIKNQPRDIHSFIKQQTQSLPSASSFKKNKDEFIPFIDVLSKQSHKTFDEICTYLRKTQYDESFTPEMLIEYLQILAVVLLLKHDLCTIFDMERPSTIEEVFTPLVTIIQEVSNKKTPEIAKPKEISKKKSKDQVVSVVKSSDIDTNVFEKCTPAPHEVVSQASSLEVQHVAKASPSIKTLGNKKVDVAAQTTEKAIEVHDVVRHLKNESVRAIMKFFKECGFDLERIHGDHRMLSNPLKQKKCILPGNLGDTVKQGTLRSVVEQSGVCELQQDELKEMIP